MEGERDIVDELYRCREWIENALEYSGGTHLYSDIVRSVLNYEMQLWSSKDSCIVTEFVNFPRKRFLHVFLCGGNMGEILDMQPAIVEFAKANGCDGLTSAGRPGWERVLGKTDWHFTHLALTREF